MKPTEILTSEHRVIEQVLNCLEAIVRTAKAAGRLDRQSAKDAVAFFRNFADRCHHGKEETHLFPTLEAKGFPRQGGPTGVMLHEHEQGRAHVRGMDENIEAAATGDPAALQQFIADAEGYVALLREHIYKEDHILFQLADRDTLGRRSAIAVGRVPKSRGRRNGRRHAREYLRIARDLAKQYGVVATATDAPSGHFHCGSG